uniref:Uncharacterized protein n=1 Tax=Rhizophora mucronata TaxID=61149 RepID=A0A2P2NHP9_RHIMU
MHNQHIKEPMFTCTPQKGGPNHVKLNTRYTKLSGSECWIWEKSFIIHGTLNKTDLR